MILKFQLGAWNLAIKTHSLTCPQISSALMKPKKEDSRKKDSRVVKIKKFGVKSQNY